MDAKERKCAINRTLEALEVAITAFTSIKETPADEQQLYQQASNAIMLTKQLLHDWHEQLARKLA